MSDPASPAPGFLRRGGWIVVAVLAVATAAFAWYAVGLVRHRAHPTGDGRHVASYGFKLEPCLVPRALLVASGMPKDGLAALADPPVWTVAQADAATVGHGRFLVPGDRVIGVRLGGAARAYPLRMLVWHEVVNDTLGGVPIAVTYDPLCDSAVAFRRELRGEALTFGVSGLLFDSNLLMYDRRAAAGEESLWSQLLFRAVAGPAAAAGTSLEVLPISVETWGDWRREHPDTTVPAPAPAMAAKYVSDPYTTYVGSDELRFPVRPLPASAAYPLKSPLVAIGAAHAWTAFPFPTLAAADVSRPTPASRPNASAALASFLSYRATGPTVAVAIDALPPGAAVVYASYFAWYAMHAPETTWAGEGRAR
ncbi:MAG: DUF3179 domain-containing (seleno)protein [Thermoanaerobaculaceae bacterium]|nr:DUF3179 domain-containing (seleno)protein [Thermoanaerobaculaceae bacterium]